MLALFELYKPGGIELLVLDADDQLVIGRNPECDVTIKNDPTVSRVHARLERVGPVWTITDLGSSNGTVVCGEPLFTTRTLRHGDEVVIGRTRLQYRDQASKEGEETEPTVKPPKLTPTEHEVLVELCRPFANGKAFSTPASVHDIAKARVTGEGSVKQHLGNLYDKFQIADGPSRRVHLANEALLSGAVTLADLKEPPPT